MILFDGKDLEPIDESSLVPELNPFEEPSFLGSWKSPLDIVKDDAILTVDGWRLAGEDAWQIYPGPDLTTVLMGRGYFRCSLPQFNLISDGSSVAYVRGVHDDSSVRSASVSDVSITRYTPLYDLGIGYRVKTDMGEGVWVSISGTSIPLDRKGRVKLNSVRAFAEGDSELRGGFKLNTVKLSNGTLTVEAQRVLTPGLLRKIERGELNYGY